MKRFDFYTSVVTALIALMVAAFIGLCASCKYVTIIYYQQPEKVEPKYEPQWELIDPIDPGFYKPISIPPEIIITPNEGVWLDTKNTFETDYWLNQIGIPVDKSEPIIGYDLIPR